MIVKIDARPAHDVSFLLLDWDTNQTPARASSHEVAFNLQRAVRTLGSTKPI